MPVIAISPLEYRSYNKDSQSLKAIPALKRGASASIPACLAFSEKHDKREMAFG